MKPVSAKRLPYFFYAVVLASIVFSFAYLALRRGAGFVEFFYQNGTSLIGDFSNNLHYPTHAKGPYFDSIWASFPPLAYTFYYIMNVSITRVKFFSELVVYIVITAFTFMALLYAIQRAFETYGKAGNRNAFALSLCILMSGISLYTIERGNSALNVMVLMLFPMYLRKSEAAWKREAALLLIALAAAMKLYPCLLGLLYLLEKRYREAFRLVLYGVVLFIVPFAWFGGVEGFGQFLSNQQGIHAIYRNDFLTSIPSVASFLAMEWGVEATGVIALAKGVAFAFGGVLLLCTCLSQKLWLRCLFLMSCATLVPGWSAEYMALYMALPCVLYFCEAPEKVGFKEIAYMLLFGGIFVSLPFGAGLNLHAPVSWSMLVCFASIYGITLLAVADVLASFAKNRKAKKTVVV